MRRYVVNFLLPLGWTVDVAQRWASRETKDTAGTLLVGFAVLLAFLLKHARIAPDYYLLDSVNCTQKYRQFVSFHSTVMKELRWAS